MPDWHTTVHENSSSCRLNESSKQKQNSKRKIGKEKRRGTFQLRASIDTTRQVRKVQGTAGPSILLCCTFSTALDIGKKLSNVIISGYNSKPVLFLILCCVVGPLFWKRRQK